MAAPSASVQVTSNPAAESARASEGAAGLWLPTMALWRREMVRFFRQRNRVLGALATPLVFWLFLGSGLDRSFQHAAGLAAGVSGDASGDASGGASGGAGAGRAVGYREYFFPGTVTLMVLFTAVFSTISVIEDRREGFLQGVLVAPIPRLAVVLGKVLGGSSIALIQGAVMLLLWPLVTPWPGLAPMLGQCLGALAVLLVLAVGLTGLGLCLAWPMDSTAGFHAVMNLVLVPMWFLSGAVFPVRTAPLCLQIVMACIPLTYGQAALTRALTGGRVDVGAAASGPAALLLTGAFAVATVALATVLVRRRRKDGLA
jgi:ABC-2 type transport system permease protein